MVCALCGELDSKRSHCNGCVRIKQNVIRRLDELALAKLYVELGRGIKSERDVAVEVAEDALDLELDKAVEAWGRSRLLGWLSNRM